MYITNELKKEIVKLITKHTSVDYKQDLLSKPPKPGMGDIAAPLFVVAKETGENPVELAKKLSSEIKSEYFEKVEAAGPYVNFYSNPDIVNQEVITSILQAKELATFDEFKGKRVMIEYFSPNTNKAMSIGHVRNLVLGSTLTRLFEKAGAKVIHATIFNDRGIAISKSMVAYDLFGKKMTPKTENKKPDQFVGDFYTKFANKVDEDPKLDVMAKEYLILWEKGDKKIRSLWKKMNSWVYKGFKETLSKLGEGDFDEVYYESDYYDKAKDIVLRHVGNGVIKRGEEGEIYADLEHKKLPNKVLLRSDQTSLYITQDLYLAQLKDEKKVDMSIYITGDEQNMQFKQLFAVLETLDASTNKYYHISYGMMRLPEGKIKSRQGLGRALADALIDEVEALAKVEIAKRQENLKEKKVNKIANQIMQAAIKFNILHVDAKKEMVFDPAEAINFTGKTGPYLQYTAVRLNSILKQTKVSKNAIYSVLETQEERQLVNMLQEYEDVIQRSLRDFNPSTLAQYLHELAQTVNHFYHESPVLKADEVVRDARVGLIAAVSKVLEDGLEVLGIEVPEQM